MDTRRSHIIITGKNDTGILYGVFSLLRLFSYRQKLKAFAKIENPYFKLRMLNQWDNMDGSVERGYAGKSIFYSNNKITKDLVRIKDYARLLSSIGINSIAINNVNVHEYETKLITKDYRQCRTY